jgi:Methylase involved in ubiquinone/menaquinone biosynthesis
MNKNNTLKSNKELYNKIAKTYQSTWDNDWDDKLEIDKFIELLKPNNNILDIGSGTGYITNYLLENKLNPIGIDYSSEMVKIAKEKYPSINFVNDDITKVITSFNKNEIDGIIAFYSLFYTSKKDVKKILKHIAKISKPNAPFLLTIKEGTGEKFVNEPLLNKEEGKNALFINLYSKKDITQLLNDNGFIIKDFIIKKINDSNTVTESNTFIITAINNKSY